MVGILNLCNTRGSVVQSILDSGIGKASLELLSVEFGDKFGNKTRIKACFNWNHGISVSLQL